MIRPYRMLSTILAGVSATSLVALGGPPTRIDYQGKVFLQDQAYTGPGYFKFALTDAGATTNYWSNDGTATNTPSAVVTSWAVIRTR